MYSEDVMVTEMIYTIRNISVKLERGLSGHSKVHLQKVLKSSGSRSVIIFSKRNYNIDNAYFKKGNNLFVS